MTDCGRDGCQISYQHTHMDDSLFGGSPIRERSLAEKVDVVISKVAILEVLASMRGRGSRVALPGVGTSPGRVTLTIRGTP